MAVEISADKITYDGVNIFDLIYPVGSIYISVNSVSPKTLFGGEWEMLPEGYALWTATSDAGSTISAGLPNITGSFQHVVDVGSKATSGAFTTNWSNKVYFRDGGSYTEGISSTTYFDASSSNSVYGSSTTVQPPSYKVYIWKRSS